MVDFRRPGHILFVVVFYNLQISINICLNINKSLINIMNLIQNGTAGYLNTIGGGMIMYTLSFEYHIQGISVVS